MRNVITLLVGSLVLGGCTPSGEEPAATAGPSATPATAPAASGAHADFIPTQADIDRFRAEGPEPTLRKITAMDYLLHYRVMQATGLTEALGGEEPAVAALKALGEAYERRLRAFETEAPRMIPAAAFTGEGMQSGFLGMGMGSFLGMFTGGTMSGMVSTMSDERLAELSSKGPLKFGDQNGKAEMQFDKDGSLSQSLEFDVNEKGVNGKVKMKMRMTACPDENGKVEVEMDVDSQMSATDKPGTGGYVHSTFKYERYLDDDARLISSADGSASRNHIRMGGFENFERQYVDITMGYQRGGEPIWEHHDEGGFSIFRMEEAERTRQLLEAVDKLQSLAAEMMLRGMTVGSPWENGRCVSLQVTSNPSNRTGLKPRTPFELEARPRLKADGKPVGGTVTATLSGGSALNPAGAKVKADAKFGYSAPAEKEEAASIAFESRSKRGVGKATLEFDTRVAKPYYLRGGPAELPFEGQVCNLEETFFVLDGHNDHEVTMRFEPGSPDGGNYSYSGTMTGYDEKGRKYTFRVHGNGRYTVNRNGEVAVGITTQGRGTVETPYGPQTANGSQRYSLEPLTGGPCEGARP